MRNSIVSTLRSLAPRMAGATARDRAVACLGALTGVIALGLISGWMTGTADHLPLLAAPLGASAVLLFAVPASPMAQPWAIIGGNTLSTLTGIGIAHLVPDTAIAAGLAVAAAIAVMSLMRCLHPPGGAASLLGVLGGPAAASWSFSFALAPIALNSVLLVFLGIVFHRFSRHAYPHRPAPAAVEGHGAANVPPQLRTGLADQDIDAALTESGETFDIARADLNRLIRRAELSALERNARVPRCRDIMSSDVFSIRADAPWGAAAALLRASSLHILPVVDQHNRVVGIVEINAQPELQLPVSSMMTSAAIAGPDASMLSLIETLSSGRHHAVLITDDTGLLLGLVTQTDMIAALAHLAVSGAAAAAKG
jgi:CBS domain-containing membrane protein